MKAITCTPKQLSREQLDFAISRAMELNPSNAQGAASSAERQLAGGVGASG